MSAVEQHSKLVQLLKKSESIHAAIVIHSIPANKDMFKPMEESTDSTVNTDLNKEITGYTGFFAVL